MCHVLFEWPLTCSFTVTVAGSSRIASKISVKKNFFPLYTFMISLFEKWSRPKVWIIESKYIETLYGAKSCWNSFKLRQNNVKFSQKKTQLVLVSQV